MTRPKSPAGNPIDTKLVHYPPCEIGQLLPNMSLYESKLSNFTEHKYPSLGATGFPAGLLEARRKTLRSCQFPVKVHFALTGNWLVFGRYELKNQKDIRVTDLDSNPVVKDPEGNGQIQTGFGWAHDDEMPHWAELFTPKPGSKEEDERFAELYSHLPKLRENLMA